VATTNKALYGASGQVITITLASLGNAVLQQSTAVDNTTNLFLDALVSVKIKAGASGVSATGTINVYAYGTVDGGTTYTANCTGSDGTLSPAVTPNNLRLIGVINLNATAASDIGGPFSVVAVLLKKIPAKWGIVIENKSGSVLDTTPANHSVTYQGIQTQAA